MAIPANILQILEFQLGDQDVQTLQAPLLVFWNNRADKSLIDPDLRSQYTLRDGIDLLLAQTWTEVDTAEGDAREAAHQKVTNLNLLRTNCDAEIVRIEARAAANRGPVTGSILHTTPRGDCHRPDPSDPRYRGDPVRRTVVADTPPF